LSTIPEHAYATRDTGGHQGRLRLGLRRRPGRSQGGCGLIVHIIRHVYIERIVHSAETAFEAMGADGFADRAGRAILATGQLVRRRVDDTRFDLTPQERQIAELARSGLSNPEIATRLFVSPRTVEYHLGKVFAKLGIHTRGELQAVLGAGPGRGPGTP